MNDGEIKSKVHSAMYGLVKDKGYAAPVDVLMAAGVLLKADYEELRFGRIDYLEHVCKVNLKSCLQSTGKSEHTLKSTTSKRLGRIIVNGAKVAQIIFGQALKIHACVYQKAAMNRLSGCMQLITSVRQRLTRQS